MQFILEDGTALPPTISGYQASKLMHSGRTATYELIAAGEFPTPTIRVSKEKVRVVTRPLLDYLALRYEIATAADPKVP